MTDSTAYREDTRPLLRPAQVDEVKDEAARLQSVVEAPSWQRAAISDMSEVRRQLRAAMHQLERQTPRAYDDMTLDRAAAREAELREQILQGMPTQEEMRRNPAGAVDKHRLWEMRNKRRIDEWKNIRLRLHASGALDELPDARDVANLEKYRPTGGSHQLNMHNEQIPGKQIHFGVGDRGDSVVMSDQHMDLLQRIDPELAARMAVLNSDQRRALKQFLDMQIFNSRKAQEDQTAAAPEPENIDDLNFHELKRRAHAAGLSVHGKKDHEIRAEYQAYLDAKGGE